MTAALDPLMTAWCAHMTAVGMSPATRRTRTKAVLAIARASSVRPIELTADHLITYLALRDLKPWTRRKYLEHVRAFAKWAGIADPTDGLRPPPRPAGLPRPISEQQLDQLLAVASGQGRAWLLLGAYCGLRSFESAKVRASDLLDAPTGRQLLVEGKGGRLDALPLPPVVDDELRPWVTLARAGAWLVDSDRLWPYANAAAVQRAIRVLGRSAGVPVTSHQLRHRYGTALYAASRDVLLVQRLMRHTSPTQTMGYVRVADADAAQLAFALPGAQPSLALAAG